MFKIYVSNITDSRVMFKNGKIEDNIETVEKILDAVQKSIKQDIFNYTFTGLEDTIVIELGIYDEDVENIEKIIQVKKLCSQSKSDSDELERI